MKNRISNIALPFIILAAIAGTGFAAALTFPNLLRSNATQEASAQNADASDITVNKQANKEYGLVANFKDGYDTVLIDQNSIQGVILTVSVGTALSDTEAGKGTLDVNVTGAMGSYIYPAKAGNAMNTLSAAEYAFAFDLHDGTYDSGKTSIEIPVEFSWMDGKQPSTIAEYSTFVRSIKDGNSGFSFSINCQF
jgi:hypothetical protein